jgi:hypothetical protein
MRIDYSKTFIKYFKDSYFKGYFFNITFKKRFFKHILDNNIL